MAEQDSAETDSVADPDGPEPGSPVAAPAVEPESQDSDDVRTRHEGQDRPQATPKTGADDAKRPARDESVEAPAAHAASKSPAPGTRGVIRPTETVEPQDSAEPIAQMTEYKVGNNHGAAAQGPNSIALQVTIQHPDGKTTEITAYNLTDRELKTTALRYAELYEQFRRATDLLRDERIVILRGPGGTGRRTTGEVLLAKLRDGGSVSNVTRFVVPAGVTMHQLVRQRSLFPANGGVVIEFEEAGRLTDRLLDALRDFAREVKGHIVVVGSSVSSGLIGRDHVVMHEMAQPIAIFERQLHGRLGSGHPAAGDLALDSAVIAYVERCGSPGEIATFASMLARGVTDGRTIEDLMATLRTPWREVAKGAFQALDRTEATTPEVAAADRHRRAFRITYALLDGLPVSTVCEVADWLLRDIQAIEAPDAPAGRPMFEDGVEDLLIKDMVPSNWTGPSNREEMPRRAHLRDTALTEAILDVVWNDYDLTRGVLLSWLDETLLRSSDAIGLRAAIAAGIFARYDFDLVMRELIAPWAMDLNGRRRQAAARALAYAAADERFAGRIRQRLNGWVGSRDSELRDTAARTYAAGLAYAAPEAAMKNLRRAATDPKQLQYRRLGSAITAAYHPGDAGKIIEELASWLNDANSVVQVQGLWGFLHLVRLLAPEPNDRWPLLLIDFKDDPLQRPRIVWLWQVALAEVTTSKTAWDLLSQWLDLANDNVGDVGIELEPLTLEILRGLSARSAHARRVLWHLKTWSRQKPDNQLIKRLRKQLEGR